MFKYQVLIKKLLTNGTIYLCHLSRIRRIESIELFTKSYHKPYIQYRRYMYGMETRSGTYGLKIMNKSYRTYTTYDHKTSWHFTNTCIWRCSLPKA